MRTRIISGFAIVLTALALIPSAAHLFALPNKITLTEEDYFVAQSVYRGWALFGVVLIFAIAVDIVFAILLQGQGTRSFLASAAALCMGLTLVIFLAEIYPVNQVTHDWTVIPDDWAELRLHWETAHAVNAVLTFVALCCTTSSALLKESKVRP
jgi:hypothetical protein